MTSRRKPSPRELFNYHEALVTIAPWWAAGPHKPGRKMPTAVRQAYQVVGHFAARHYAPRKGTPHPRKSSTVRLKALPLLLEHAPLPSGFKIVSRRISTASRSWTSSYLQVQDPAGFVTRYRAGLRRPMISIRGSARGRASQAPNPCDWRPLTKKEASSLHPVTIAFLDALLPSWRSSYRLA